MKVLETGNTVATEMNFEEMAIWMEVDTQADFKLESFYTKATNPGEKNVDAYATAEAFVRLCPFDVPDRDIQGALPYDPWSWRGNDHPSLPTAISGPVNQGEPVCLQICLLESPKVHITGITSLNFTSSAYSYTTPANPGAPYPGYNGAALGPFEAFPNGAPGFSTSQLGCVVAPGTYTEASGRRTCDYHCCVVETVLPAAWFPPYYGDSRTVKVKGILDVGIGAARRSLRMLQAEDHTKEFEMQVALAPAPEEASAAFRYLTFLGIVNAVGGALLI
jgi:hypothetical protein